MFKFLFIPSPKPSPASGGGLKIKFILFCSVLFLASNTHATCTVTDDAGNTITLAKPATRIISLAPDITENLFAIGAGASVVGVIAGSDYPAPAQHLPVVGSYTGLDLEKILGLHPDLIVTWGSTFLRQTLALKRMHIPVYVVTPVYLADIPHTQRQLGCLTGHAQQADHAATAFTNAIVQLQQQYQHNPPQKVFYQLGSYSLMTINKKSWINQAIELCGGKNIFADANVITPEVSWESVIAAAPEVILSDATQADWRKRWHPWQTIPAVAHSRLYNLNPDWIDRAGPRLIKGVAQICASLNQPGKPS